MKDTIDSKGNIILYVDVKKFIKDLLVEGILIDEKTEENIPYKLKYQPLLVRSLLNVERNFGTFEINVSDAFNTAFQTLRENDPLTVSYSPFGNITFYRKHVPLKGLEKKVE